MLSDENKAKAYNLVKDLFLGYKNLEELKEDFENLAEDWIPVHHFGYGIFVRNYLRKHGLAEIDIGIENWDDYYSSIIENVVFQEFGIDMSKPSNEEYKKKYYL